MLSLRHPARGRGMQRHPPHRGRERHRMHGKRYVGHCER
ncbi:hypothetical protein [Planktothrix phage Pag-Yong1]|nr:hypothetical protein [Planktothrix phage Pag-Yong1]